jgi:hypothetical protein
MIPRQKKNLFKWDFLSIHYHAAIEKEISDLTVLSRIVFKRPFHTNRAAELGE